jgi:hypothetical protein
MYRIVVAVVALSLTTPAVAGTHLSPGQAARLQSMQLQIEDVHLEQSLAQDIRDETDETVDEQSAIIGVGTIATIAAAIHLTNCLVRLLNIQAQERLVDDLQDASDDCADISGREACDDAYGPLISGEMSRLDQMRGEYNGTCSALLGPA